jgi:hypothetical protein
MVIDQLNILIGSLKLSSLSYESILKILDDIFEIVNMNKRILSHVLVTFKYMLVTLQNIWKNANYYHMMIFEEHISLSMDEAISLVSEQAHTAPFHL